MTNEKSELEQIDQSEEDRFRKHSPGSMSGDPCSQWRPFSRLLIVGVGVDVVEHVDGLAVAVATHHDVLDLVDDTS